MPLTVHMLHEPQPGPRAQLEAQLHAGITLTYGDPPPRHDFEVLVAGRPDRDLLDSLPDLRVLVIPWAGLPDTTRATLADYPHIAVHNLHHNAIPTAEMALALLLAAAKWLVPADQALRRGDWSPRYAPAPAILLHGKTALILGYGAIGQHVGRVLDALGMTVLATRRSITEPQDQVPARVYPADHLRELLPRADVLVITLPLTDDTENLINRETLALLPRGSVLVNVGRGAIVDPHALYDALQNGPLAAAASDVWYTYPHHTGSQTDTLPSDAPLHTLDNMVLSPHRAGLGGIDEIEQMRMAALADLLNALAAGDDSVSRVNVAAGY